jgi:hypothetical protein
MCKAIALGLLLAVAAGSPSCSFIPPYSSVKKQDVSGFHTLKFRTGAYSSIDNEVQDVARRAGIDDTSIELDRFSSYGLEVERLLGQQFSATVSLDAREYHVPNEAVPIRANQVHAGVRRYFGDRALTGFLAAQLIYNFGLEVQEQRFETDGYLGWGAGIGANLALSENFSIETYLMYEGMPDIESRLLASDTASGFSHNLSGLVGYVALGFHF